MNDEELRQKIEEELKPLFDRITQTIFNTYKSLNDRLADISTEEKEQVILAGVKENTRILQQAINMVGGK